MKKAVSYVKEQFDGALKELDAAELASTIGADEAADSAEAEALAADEAAAENALEA